MTYGQKMVSQLLAIAKQPQENDNGMWTTFGLLFTKRKMVTLHLSDLFVNW